MILDLGQPKNSLFPVQQVTRMSKVLTQFLQGLKGLMSVFPFIRPLEVRKVLFIGIYDQRSYKGLILDPSEVSIFWLSFLTKRLQNVHKIGPFKIVSKN